MSFSYGVVIMPIPKEKFDEIKLNAQMIKRVLGIKDLKSCSEEDKIIYQAMLTYEVNRMLREYDKEGHKWDYYEK